MSEHLTRAERQIDAARIRGEHDDEVNERAHWAYFLAILVGGTALMLGFIALLGH